MPRINKSQQQETERNLTYLKSLIQTLLEDSAITNTYRKRLLAAQICLSNVVYDNTVPYDKVMRKYGLHRSLTPWRV